MKVQIQLLLEQKVPTHKELKKEHDKVYNHGFRAVKTWSPSLMGQHLRMIKTLRFKIGQWYRAPSNQNYSFRSKIANMISEGDQVMDIAEMAWKERNGYKFALNADRCLGKYHRAIDEIIFVVTGKRPG